MLPGSYRTAASPGAMDECVRSVALSSVTSISNSAIAHYPS